MIPAWQKKAQEAEQARLYCEHMNIAGGSGEVAVSQLILQLKSYF